MAIKGKKVQKRVTKKISKKVSKKMIGGADQYLNPGIIDVLIETVNNPGFNVSGYLPAQGYPNAVVCRLIRMNNHHLLLEFQENHTTGLPHHYLLLNNFETFMEHIHGNNQITDIVVVSNDANGALEYVNIMGAVYQAIVSGQQAALQMIEMGGEFGITQEQLRDFFGINNVALVTMNEDDAIDAFNALPVNAQHNVNAHHNHFNALPPVPPVPHVNHVVHPPAPPLMNLPSVVGNVLRNNRANQPAYLNVPNNVITLTYNQKLIANTRAGRIEQSIHLTPMPEELGINLRNFSQRVNSSIVPSVIVNGNVEPINNYGCTLCGDRFNNTSNNKKAIHINGTNPYCPHLHCKECLYSMAKSACIPNGELAPTFIVNCSQCRAIYFNLGTGV